MWRVGSLGGLTKIHGDWVAQTDDHEWVRVDTALVATPGRTRAAEEVLIERHGEEAVEAIMHEGWPLLTEVDERGRLTVGGVLDAYERALKLAADAEELALGHGVAIESVQWPLVAQDTNRIVFFDHRDALPCTGLLRDSDLEAFVNCEIAVHRVEGFNDRQLLLDFASDACGAALKWRQDPAAHDQGLAALIEGAADTLVSAYTAAVHTRTQDAIYAAERETWISEHGSDRLHKAAARGYRHDGIYRDERLAEELPDFIAWIGKNAQVREVVNPTAAALEMEEEALASVSGLGLELPVRIVWVSTGLDADLRDGEYIRIDGYLGRHTVYRSVKPRDDDIPF
jgi:hypothetical protein